MIRQGLKKSIQILCHENVVISGVICGGVGGTVWGMTSMIRQQPPQTSIIVSIAKGTIGGFGGGIIGCATGLMTPILIPFAVIATPIAILNRKKLNYNK
jgi:hypothetical protein